MSVPVLENLRGGISLSLAAPDIYDVIYVNGKCIGQMYKEVDGYYVFDPGPRIGGYWPGWLLGQLHNTLDRLNREWDEHIAREIGDGSEQTVR